MVATPGRLVDFVERGAITLNHVKHFILDEADRMLDMGFSKSITQIFSGFDLPEKKQVLMYSATFADPIKIMAQKFLNNYLFLTIGKIGGVVDTINQKFIFAESMFAKRKHLMEILREEKGKKILIFCSTKMGCESMMENLRRDDIDATTVHGDKSQGQRSMALKFFSQGKVNVLIATNVAARGLHIDDIQVVINFDLPEEVDDYVHRIGRTGRVGKSGIAYSLVTPDIDGKLAGDLVSLLTQAKKEVPEFLRGLTRNKVNYGQPRYRDQGSHNNNRGNNNFRKPSYGDDMYGRSQRSPSNARQDFGELKKRSPFF